MSKIYGLHIDALRLCYEVVEPFHIEALKQVEVGETYDEFETFYLLRIAGKHFDYVYQVRYNEFGENLLFGELRLGINKDAEANNIHTNGCVKAWINVSNRVLYNDEIHYLDFITCCLGLEVHNITCLDICADVSVNVARRLKRLIRNKNITTILNGCVVRDRSVDRPEITFQTSGDMDRDKYLTTMIKQRKAIRDKSRGTTIVAYDKRAEILNSSKKSYILDCYDNPTSLYRVEVHLNNDEVKDYLKSHVKDEHFHYYSLIFNEELLWKIFSYHLHGIIYFKDGNRKIDWADILLGDITTTPAKQVPQRVKAEKSAV
ncbi:hypothetical protein M2480_001797 [Parabacteroides sp. PFB2-12]|uniref:hypothetical protein n=1 Tax=unclassified Parabacteroides TaxID=2649774 RepID=UPI00247484EF|nr:MULTISPECIES: hypothetical protein [unclassified Parabacteroides]MDH6343171.1 hypothetical protein [Parabacteroides sp. PM6-13]MDH6390815.1 hypothetical protein [Parabacteroides sp. PFB2-12]